MKLYALAICICLIVVVHTTDIASHAGKSPLELRDHIVKTHSHFPSKINPPMRNTPEMFMAPAPLVGGTVAASEAWPWEVSLQEYYQGAWVHICGAALIDADFAVTAAYCLQGVNIGSLRLMIGGNNVTNSSDAQYVNIRAGLMSEMYADYFPYTFDIAVIHLETTAEIRLSNIEPIKLAQPGQDFDNQLCYVLGWGETDFIGTLPTELMQGQVRVLSNWDCECYFPHLITPAHVCAFDGSGQVSPCFGDGGSSLICQQNSKWYLVGVASSVPNSCTGSPTIYTRIQYPEIRTWVKNLLSA